MAKFKIRTVVYYEFYCKGCKHPHVIPVSDTGWTFNNDLNNPTFSPSVLNELPKYNEETKRLECSERCHLFIRNGKIEYLNDCFHELKGQTIDLIDY